MQFLLCCLRPKGYLHLGEREQMPESTSDFVHSDTLFSAFCHCYRLLYGNDELELLLEKFADGNPPFCISSAFPFAEEEYFFPTPMAVCWREGVDRKTQKKLRWVPKQLFENIIAGKEVDPPTTDPDDEKQPLTISDTIIPRIQVNRLGHAPAKDSGAYFQFSQVSFGENSGLFFLLLPGKDFDQKRFTASLNLLADEGLGGDRTVGRGLFYQPQWYENFQLKTPENSNGQILISLWHPHQKEQHAFSKQSYYRLIARRGYVFSPDHRNFRRKSVVMVSEGSVIAGLKEPPKGTLVDVTPAQNGNGPTILHRIYRYGIAFSLPYLICEKYRES